MATLITGGSGFIGLNLAERLLGVGEDVILFGQTAPPQAALTEFRGLPGQLAVGVGDVRSAADLDRAFGLAPVGCVVHAAAVTASVERERTDPRTIMDVNLQGAINVIEAMLRYEVSRILLASSIAVYGFPAAGPDGTLTEQECIPSPTTLYGISKLAAEQTAARLAQLHDLTLTIARIGPTFGPWEHHSGVRDVLSPQWQSADLARAGMDIQLSRSAMGDWLYSRDAAEGLALLLKAPDLAHQIYNVGSGETWALEDWVAGLVDRLPGVNSRPLRADSEGMTVRVQTAIDRPPMSIKRLVADTGYAPRFNLNASLTDYLAWLDAHPGFPKN
jgi:nucleoside-diphosphate-sugar epimerase